MCKIVYTHNLHNTGGLLNISFNAPQAHFYKVNQKRAAEVSDGRWSSPLMHTMQYQRSCLVAALTANIHSLALEEEVMVCQLNYLNKSQNNHLINFCYHTQPAREYHRKIISSYNVLLLYYVTFSSWYKIIIQCYRTLALLISNYVLVRKQISIQIAPITNVHAFPNIFSLCSVKRLLSFSETNYTR